MSEPAAEEYQLPVKQTNAFFEKVKKELPADKHEQFLKAFEPFTPPYENGPPKSVDEILNATAPFLQDYPDLLNEFKEIGLPPPVETPKGKAFEEYLKKLSAMSREEQEAHFKDFFEKQFKKDGAELKADEPPKNT